MTTNDQKQALILQGFTLEGGQYLAPGVLVQAPYAQVQIWVESGLAQKIEQDAAPQAPKAGRKRGATTSEATE